jgi:osmotically-inducible protein OsmY
VEGVLSVNSEVDVRYPEGLPIPTDQETEARIVTLLDWSSDVDASNVRVNVVAGLVTLQGSVGSYWQKQRAERLASGVNGVMDIKNRLVVVPERAPVDETVADWIVSALDRNPHVDVDSIHVRVDKGAVRLSGTVPNWAGFVAAEEDVKRTAGVTEVRNELVIE